MAVWENAYELRGRGSTFDRARLMFSRILEPAAPTIRSQQRRDAAAEEFRSEVKHLLRAAVEEIEEEQEDLAKLLDAPR